MWDYNRYISLIIKFLASDCDANCEVESHCESIKENSDGFETCSNDEKCYHGNGTCDPSK